MSDEIDEIRLLVKLVLRAVEALPDSASECAGLYVILEKLAAMQARTV